MDIQWSDFAFKNSFVLALCKKITSLETEVNGLQKENDDLKNANNDLKSENNNLNKKDQEQETTIDKLSKDLKECQEKGMRYKIALFIKIYILEAVYLPLVAGL